MSFHVTEMARVIDGPLRSDCTFGNNGAFDLESPEPGWRLGVIASDGSEDAGVADALGWEHVSARAYRGSQSRTPTWKEMGFLKGLFWDDEDVVMQLHPKRSEYVNNHPHVLHLWRHRTREIPTPPSLLVGVFA